MHYGLKYWRLIMKNKGFTLAEVLITLGVIGVVAAITISTIIKNYQEKVTVIRFNHAVSLLSQGFRNMAVDAEGDLRNLTGQWNDWRHLNSDFYKKYFKINKMCIPYGTYNECVPYTTYALDKKSPCRFWCDNYSHEAILANGMIFCIQSSYNREGYKLGIDINGPKGPNASGYDIFVLKVKKDGSITYHDYMYDNFGCVKGSEGASNGPRCAEWIMKHQNMEYLHRVIGRFAEF